MEQEEKKELELKEDVLAAYGKDVDEAKYAQHLIQEINDDLELREKESYVFNGLSYSKAYEYNQRKAINYSPPRNVKDDREVSLGLVHEKIVSFAAIFLKYLFKYRIKCYDDKGRLIRGMGKIYELGIEYSRKVEQFAKTLGLIYWEVFTQGNAFILEDWEVKMVENPKAFKKAEGGEKQQVTADSMDYTYEFLDELIYEEGEQMQIRRARSVVLDGRQVIFKNPEIEELQEQGRIVLEEEISAESAKAIFGTLKRWANVPKQAEQIEAIVGEKTTLFSTTRIKSPSKTFIVHRVYDKDNNRFNIFLNGIMMLPRHTPMTLFYPRGNYPISNIPAERLRGSIYARSIPAKTKFNADFVDWALKMLANKFEQGIDPAILSKGKYTLTRDMFRGGQVTHGVSREDYEKADPDNQGVTPAEFSFVNLLKQIMEAQTINPTTVGEAGGQADTLGQEVMLENNQRDKLGFLLDGLIIGSMDLVLRRAETIEAKYTIKQRETIVDGKTIAVYQNFSVNVAGVENVVDFNEEVGGEGYDEEGQKNELFKRSFHDKKGGFPAEYYLVNPHDLREKRYNLVVDIIPERIKDTNLQLQIMWEDFANRLNIFGESNNIEEMKKEYLEVSGKPDTIFTQGTPFRDQLMEAEQMKPQQSRRGVKRQEQVKV